MGASQAMLLYLDADAHSGTCDRTILQYGPEKADSRL